jgi:DNA-directed RNA polymerase specialized sigma24 family protein
MPVNGTSGRQAGRSRDLAWEPGLSPIADEVDVPMGSQVEFAFSVLLRQFTDGNVDAALLRWAIAVVNAWAVRIARLLLRRWHIRNARIEAEEVVQQWNVELLTGALARFDRRRSLLAYVYRILRRCCVAVVKREARIRFIPSKDEPVLERAAWLEAFEHTQHIQELLHAISQLPPKQREAVERWLAHRAAGSRMVFLTTKARREFHNRMYQARRRLAAILTDTGEPSDSARQLTRAA